MVQSMPTFDEVYRKFGEVSEAAQLLETELGTIQLCVDGLEHSLFTTANSELATELYNKINKSTLGQILRRLIKSADMPCDVELLIAKALAHRNQLFHSFYRKHNFRRNSDDGRTQMLADLDQKHQVILDAYKAVLLLSGLDLNGLTDTPLPTLHVKI